MSQTVFLPKADAAELAASFAPIKPPLLPKEAVIEASRCLFCHDAPCITACPSAIDIPMFIRQIMSHNTKGAAKTIFTQNIMGKSCGQVCPTEVLCEGSCVYEHLNEKPIDIGRLQAYATSHAIENNIRFFHKGESTGKKVAIVGGGPAGLACAHELTRLGHEAVVFEANDKAGGLNAYGVAPYKYSNTEAAQEVDYVAQIGFEIRTNTRIVPKETPPNGSQAQRVLMSELENDFDAIFLGVGLGKSRKPGIPGEQLERVHGAAEFIHRLRAKELQVDVGRKVVVIGAGNTAIDACVESAKLGAEVTLVYRRTVQDQNAYYFEVDLAKLHGIQFRYLTSPVEILGDTTPNGGVTGLRCVQNEVKTSPDHSGKSDIAPIAGSEFTIPCDMVILATGQEKQVDFFKEIQGLTVKDSKIAVNEHFQTTNPKYFAGGDCVNGGKEVVNAVAHGRDAARGIHQYLTAKKA